MVATDLLATLIPVGAVAVSVISAIVAMGRGKLKLGQLMIDFDRSAASDIRQRLEDKGHDSGFRQYALLREYHAQGLAQSVTRAQPRAMVEILLAPTRWGSIQPECACPD